MIARVADVTDDAAGREDFHEIVPALYGDAGARLGPPPDRGAVERNLARDVFRGRQRLFVAYDGVGRATGRVAARVAPALRDPSDRPYGLLSFFECRDDPRAAGALFTAAVAWLHGRGTGNVVGPMDGDTWHRYRVNAGPFDRPPFPMEPWNPPWYAALWDECGFRPVEHYSSKWIADVSMLLAGLEPGRSRSESHGVRIRGLRPTDLDAELSVVHAMTSEIFKDAFLYSPIPRDEFLALYRGMERFLDPELVVFAVAPDGTHVGLVFAYADPRDAALVHYKTIGVLPAWRAAGVASALAHRVYTAALARRRPAGNHALMRDDNRSQALDQGHGAVFRRYTLYQLAS